MHMRSNVHATACMHNRGQHATTLVDERITMLWELLAPSLGLVGLAALLGLAIFMADRATRVSRRL